jgi:signal transduction histidine kinase
MAVMESTAKKDGDDYRINGELYEMILTNVRAAERALKTFGDMMTIVTENHRFEKMSLWELHDRITEKTGQMSDVAAVKNHHLVLSDKKAFFRDMYIEVNIRYFLQALEEVILNSFKFSLEGSTVVILFMAQKDKCSIDVINDIITNEKGIKGIPTGYENLVFEPFYRLTKTVNDGYNTLDYGLGLTLTEKIVTKHGGSITINNITDYSDIKAGPKTKVECSMTFNAVP